MKYIKATKMKSLKSSGVYRDKRASQISKKMRFEENKNVQIQFNLENVAPERFFARSQTSILMIF